MSGEPGPWTHASALLLALLLHFVAVPAWLAPAWPMWVPMVVVSAVFSAPAFPVMPAAFVAGLCLDVLLNCVLGQHAVSLLMLAYVAALVQPSLAIFPRWQVALALVPLWAGYALLLGVLDEMTHHVASPTLRWWPLLPTALLWPWLDATLTSMQYRRRRHD